jgi:hypothetical protein
VLSDSLLSRAPSNPLFSSGTAVRVRNTLGSWAGGFEVVSVGPSGYLLRRVSDGVLLPTPIPATAVRSL